MMLLKGLRNVISEFSSNIDIDVGYFIPAS